jgi:uncharacterized repeat protein (TIGR02543 family)
LFMSENPDAGGNVSPAPPGAWYDAGVSATIDATVNSGYAWSGWTGDLTGTDKPKTFTMSVSKSVTANFTVSPSTVQITLGTSPTGREFIVDGAAYSATQVFTWAQGSTHNLTINAPQSGATGTRYLFQSWSDLGAQNHTYTVPSGNETVTAYFKTQYELKVVSERGSPTGAGWYDAGNSTSFGITSPEAGGTGNQFAFTGWTGTGSGSYTGNNTSKSIAMNNTVTETAAWKTQYMLFTSENPDAGGNMTPAPPGTWYDSGASATLDAMVASGYNWSGWSGDVTGTEKPKSVTMNASKNVWANFSVVSTVAITVTADPSGKSFLVDGTSCSGSQVFNWIPGSTHTLSVESPQHVEGGSKWVFVNWSDGGAQSHTYTVPSGPATVQANFKCMVLLTVNSEKGNPQGGGWYDSGATAAFSVTVPVDDGNKRYLFLNWSGDGSGTSPSVSVVMGGPKSVTANWKLQYNLRVVSLYGNPRGDGWYDVGVAAAFSVTTPAVQGNTRRIFDYWSGGTSGTSPGGSITMNEPKTIQAIWHTQHFLSTALSPPSSGTVNPPPPGAWYDEGEIVGLSASPGPGYLWDGWSGDASGKKNPAAVFIDGPKSVTARFGTTSSYIITTDPPGLAIRVDGSEYVSPCDFPWAIGTTHTIGVDSLVSGGTGIRHLFKTWSDGKARIHQLTADNTTLSFTAAMETHFYLTTVASPDTGGSPIPAPPGTWLKKGTVATLYAICNILRGFAFAGWGGSRSGTANPDTVAMHSPRLVIANFSVQTFSFSIRIDPPSRFALEQNYPNPFNPETSIRFSLSEAGPVRLMVYNTMGGAVRTLVNEIRSAGTYQAVWDGRSDKGREVSAGTYLIILQSGGQTRKMKTSFMK